MLFVSQTTLLLGPRGSLWSNKGRQVGLFNNLPAGNSGEACAFGID